MEIPSWLKYAGYFVGLSIASQVAWDLYKISQKPKKKSKKRLDLAKKSIQDVLFFSEQSALCRTHANDPKPCPLPTCPIKPLNKLMGYLSSATKTLDICVYFLTYNAIVKLIRELHTKRDVEIRVITDDESTENDASQIFTMRKAGIKVRTRKSLYLMHHKFAIVDNKLLITGSANWTIQAFFGNCENILITNQSQTVKNYMREYEKIWSKYDIDYTTEMEMHEKMLQENLRKESERYKKEQDFGL